MFQDIAIDVLFEKRKRGELILVDVRSPSEYREASIPGSLNIPLFDDAERAEIGTLYKQASVDAAKTRGLEIVSAKLPAFIKQFAALPGKTAVFCWRGGMRSKTTATVLSLMGIHAYRLTGGYRAYRRSVVDALSEMDFAPKLIVLHGNTGTGKTAILRALQARGCPALDLEAMAGHRGSAFGHIGLPAHNQKTFDALLFDELSRFEQAPYVFMEAESKRIGKVTVPDFLMRKKEEGLHVRIEMPVEARVNTILNDYRPEAHHEACLQAFRLIKSRLHTPVAAEIETLLEERRYDRAVALLLIHYYDPRYAHSSEAYESTALAAIRADTAEEAAEELLRLVGGGLAVQP
ncbi:tRNA 2-selenouridine(34) synthase MnmH [Cohnella nanjingensis]|uniref:tRNA 2-selenouridine(34) synthase MnmH n=1 Tax=Cohnella nanjingensis TaxID=1387779 RepID=A0A7X0RS43_9BACL|nr:tRNA 2-selenouridine(34) synthase MnmH [Cohnella nanjingensis]MBB6672674.1 tRNA 2-selenouridine(34) synthase MnmH [Cohnella nanjingensis]